MVFGPIVQINTTMAGLTLDIGRALNLGTGAGTLRLVRPDHTEVSKWAIVREITSGWNRVGGEERARGRGYTVHYQIADLYGGQLADWLAGDERATHILQGGVYYEIDDVPTVPPDEAQVYDISCRTHTLVRATD